MGEIKVLSKVFQTTDGKLFENAREAKKHQAEINLREALVEDSLLGNYAGSHVEWDDLLEWLRDHRQVVLDVLSRG